MTAGPWGLRGRQIRAEGGLGRHVADYMVDAEDGHLLAAAPELERLLRELLVSLGKLSPEEQEPLLNEASDAWDILNMLEDARERIRRLG
jgi:hypothetical protein